MKRKFVIAAIILQFFILLYMCGKRELIIRTGETIYIRTAPVDPRDLFRGDFVRLKYELSSVPSGRQKINDYNGLHKGTSLYAMLRRHDNGLAELLYITDREPDSGTYIRGYSNSGRYFKKGQPLNVRFGIESYYVQQGRGIKIEEKIGRFRRRKDTPDLQTPLEMRIALSSGGTAVITGHRWSPLGHGLRILWSADIKAGRNRAMRAVFTIKNTSTKAIALVQLPGNRSFTLDPRGVQGITASSPRMKRGIPSDRDVLLLPPGRTRRFTLDLSNPWFFVKDKHGKRVPAYTLEKERFRIVYRPPSVRQCRHLKLKDKIWHGFLPSSAFNGSGWID